jgi:hypothetical protein
VKVNLTLVDDGTMDTVFECSECERHIRFLDFPRDWDGGPMLDAIDDATAEHEEECEGSGSEDYKPERHNGEWIQ